MNTDHDNAQSGKVSHTPWEPHCVNEHSSQNRAHELSTITFDFLEKGNLPDISEFIDTINVFLSHLKKTVMCMQEVVAAYPME